MDSPPLRLILIVWRTLVEYLGWVLQHSSSARCEACQRCIFHTSWAQASHLDHTRVNCIDQSIPEPLLHRPVVHGSSSLLSPHSWIYAFSVGPIQLFGCSSPVCDFPLSMLPALRTVPSSPLDPLVPSSYTASPPSGFVSGSLIINSRMQGIAGRTQQNGKPHIKTWTEQRA